MLLRKGHGAGKGTPRIETPKPAELPEGVPDVTRPDSKLAKGKHGFFTKGNKLAAVGGRAKKGSSKLAIKS